MEKKIIFIGFNKTATTFIHHTMLKNGFDSKHRAGVWRFKGRYDKLKNIINRRDVVSDWGDTHIPISLLERINSDFDDVLFVLNTRNLIAWVESRFKHYYYNKSWDFDGREVSLEDVNLENANKFILQRNAFYSDVCEFFDNKKNFIVLDIDQQYFYDILSRRIN